jgi:tetratricopeptide (TPR) repeat protein
MNQKKLLRSAKAQKLIRGLTASLVATLLLTGCAGIAAECRLAEVTLEAERWLARGHTLRSEGRLAEAVQAYDRAIDLQPDSARAWCLLGHALYLQGRYREALLAFEWGDDLGSRGPNWDFPSARWVNMLRPLAEAGCVDPSGFARRRGNRVER